MPTDTPNDSYLAAVNLDARTLESTLRESLGSEIVAALLDGLPDDKPSTPDPVWGGDLADPTTISEGEMSIGKRTRLINAYRTYRLARFGDRSEVARNWFVAANPNLSERSPLDALVSEGNLAPVLLSAERLGLSPTTPEARG